RRRVEVQVDEDEAQVGLDARRVEPEARLVEAGDAAALRRSDQLAVEVVRPPVVRAPDRLAARLRPGDQARTAVPADVEVRGEGAVLCAYDQDFAVAHLDGEPGARVRQVRLVTRELPRTGEDVLAFQHGDGRVGVVAGGEPGRGRRVARCGGPRP